MPGVWEWGWPLAGYLCGAIPFGAIVARIKGVDIFSAGSGNVGATNVGRVLGRKYGILVFVLDVLKGAAPTASAVTLAGPGWPAVATGLAAVLGHMFSPLLRFRGGKGVATGAGAVAVLLPAAAGLATTAFVATILAGATMSPASIAAAVVLAATQWAIQPSFTAPATLFASLVAVLVVWRHRGNIARLRAGSEPRLRSLARTEWLTPPIHVTALALWFGGGAFFSLGVATGLFAAFRELAAQPPDWLPLARPVEELGSRLAGVAVGPLFPRYFILQAVCGVIATGTAVGWLLTRPSRVTRVRAALLLAALAVVAVGWPVNRVVSDLRAVRFADATARDAFATWHLVSLGLNLFGLLLLAVATPLAGLIGQGGNGMENSTNPSGDSPAGAP